MYRRSLFPFPRRLLYAVLLFTLCPMTPILSLAGCQTLPDGLSVRLGTSRTKHCFVSCFSLFPHWIHFSSWCWPCWLLQALGPGLTAWMVVNSSQACFAFCLTLWLVLFRPASFGSVGVVLDLLTHFFLWCVCLMMFGRPEWHLACLWALASLCLVSAPPLFGAVGRPWLLGSFPCVLHKGLFSLLCLWWLVFCMCLGYRHSSRGLWTCRSLPRVRCRRVPLPLFSQRLLCRPLFELWTTVAYLWIAHGLFKWATLSSVSAQA